MHSIPLGFIFCQFLVPGSLLFPSIFSSALIVYKSFSSTRMASGSDQLPFHHLLQISSDNYEQQMQDAVSNFNVFLTRNNNFLV